MYDRMSGILEVFYSIFPVPDIIGRSLSGPPLPVEPTSIIPIRGERC